MDSILKDTDLAVKEAEVMAEETQTGMTLPAETQVEAVESQQPQTAETQAKPAETPAQSESAQPQPQPESKPKVEAKPMDLGEYANLLAEIDVELAEARGKAAECEKQLDIVTASLQKRREEIADVEKSIAELNEKREKALAEGKDTARLRSVIGDAYEKKNQLENEITEIEEKVLPGLEKKYSQSSYELGQKAEYALSQKMAFAIKRIQDLFDKFLIEHRQWDGLCQAVCKKYSARYYQLRQNPLSQVSIEKNLAEMLKTRLYEHNAKLSRQAV